MDFHFNCKEKKLGNCVQGLKKPHAYILKLPYLQKSFTTQKMKFSINNFFSEYDQICRKLQIWSHLLKKSLTENSFFV